MIYASELMELARKNPGEYEGKKYKVTDCNERKTNVKDHGGKIIENIKVENGELMVDKPTYYDCTAFVNSRALLEPLPQPVTFMEAVNSGRLIKPNENNVFVYKLLCFWLDYLANNANGDRTNLINGGWLIEP